MASPKNVAYGLKMAPQVRDLETRKKIAKLEKYQNEPVGIGGRPPTSI
jgi:hypothetical protein